MKKPITLVKELHLPSLREKYMSDPDIIPPSGTTKQEYVDQMVGQLERQNRNNSRAYSLLTPTASDTAEGGGSDMYVQINRIKKAAKMLQKSYDEEDYMQAIKLSMQRHADDYSFLKAKEVDPPKYNIVHRYEIQGKGDRKKARPFIVVDSPTLDAPITLSRNTPGYAGSNKEQSWFPVYGHHNEWGHGGGELSKVSVAHVKALEAHIRATPELSGNLEGVPTTDEFVEENFSDQNIFPRQGKTGEIKHQSDKVGKQYTTGLGPFGRRAQVTPDGPERPVFDAWMAHIKSIANALPKHSPNKAGKFEGEIAGLPPKSPLYGVIHAVHHTRLGGEGGSLARTFNYPSFETMNKINPDSTLPEWQQEKLFAPIKRSSPEELIGSQYPEGSGIRESLLPMMKVIHDINEDSDIEDSPVWTESKDGVEHHSINLQDIDTALEETNNVHLDAITKNVTPARAKAAFINSSEFQALNRMPTTPANVVPKLSGALKHTGTHDAPQTMHQILSNHVMGESAPSAAIDTTQEEDDLLAAENAVDAPEVPQAITDYFKGGLGTPPMSREQFDSLSNLRQHVIIDSILEQNKKIKRVIDLGGASPTKDDFHAFVANLKDELHDEKSGGYLDSAALLAGKSRYSEDVSRVMPETLSTNEAPVETPEEEPIPAAAEEVTPEDAAPAEDEDAVDTEEVTPKDTAPVAQVEEDDDKVSDDQTEDEELTDEEQDLQIESGGAFFDNFSEEEQQAVLEASRQLPDSQRANLIAFIEAGDFDQLDNFISDPTISPTQQDDAEPVEEVATEDSDSGFNTAEQGALEIIGQVIKNPQTPLSQLPLDVQLGIAQAALQIERVEAKDISELKKRSPNASANEREKFIASAKAKRTLLIRAVESGDLKKINEQVQNFRGDNYERTTSRATDESGTGRIDGKRDGEPVVPAASGDAGKSGVTEGSSAEVENQNVDGDPTGGPVSDEVAVDAPEVTDPVSKDGRIITTVELEDGTVQPFYRRTGTGGKDRAAEAGQWVPFDGIHKGGFGTGADGVEAYQPQGWFDKHAYTKGEDGESLEDNDPLKGYGTQEHKEIGERLDAAFDAGNLFENQADIIKHETKKRTDGSEYQSSSVRGKDYSGSSDEPLKGAKELNKHLAEQGSPHAKQKIDRWEGRDHRFGLPPDEDEPVNEDNQGQDSSDGNRATTSDNGVQGRLFNDDDGDDKDATPPPPPPPTTEDAPEEDSDEINHRMERIAKLGDDALGALVDEDEFGYHTPDAVRRTLLNPKVNTAKQFSAHMERARETHKNNQETERRTSSKSHRGLRDSIRNKKGLHDVIQEHISDHVATHDGRDVHDLKYKDLGTYVRYLNSLSDDARRKELEEHQKTAATRAEDKEKEEVKAAETAETEANKEKQEQDKAAWATESQRVQQQMTDMPTILGPDGKISDKWDNSAALHYFRNANKIIFHDTRVNLQEAGVDTSGVKDLSSLMYNLNSGKQLSSDLSGKITGSLMAINKVLTPRQKRDLSEEMQTVDDYMGEDHRKQLALDNETSRSNEEDYQKRGQSVVDKGIRHEIFSSIDTDKYRDEDGKIIPLYSDPEDMKKKDEEDALRREEGNMGEETQAEKAKRRTSQGHPATESPGEGYAYHPETGHWMDRERLDSMTSHLDEHLKPGESVSFAPANTVHTEHIGRDKDGKRGVVLKAHEPLTRGTQGASDYVSATKNKDGQLIWSPVKPPEQNKHGFISPDDVQHATGNSALDERLNNAHAVGQIKGTFHTREHEEGSSGDHARHGLEHNIIRHHSLGGTAAPKNTLPMGDPIGGRIRGVLQPENFSNVAGNILNFSRKHGGSLAKKLKLDEMSQKVGQSAAGQRASEAAQQVGETARKVGAASKDVTGLYSKQDVASLLYNPLAMPKLYNRLFVRPIVAGAKKVIETAPVGTDKYGVPKGGRTRETDPLTGEETPRSWTGSGASRSRVPGVEGVKSAVSGTKARLAAVVPSEVSEAAGAVTGAAKKSGVQVGEKTAEVAERAAMGAAGAVDTATEKLRGIGSALQSRKDSIASETDKVKVEQDAARFGSEAATGGKKMDRAANRRQARDVTRRTGTASKDVQLTHPEPDTPVGKLQGFVGSVHSGREHRVDTGTSVAARPVTPTPEATPASPDVPESTPDTTNEPGTSRAERRKQKFGSKPGASPQTDRAASVSTPTAAPQPRPLGGYQKN